MNDDKYQKMVESVHRDGSAILERYAQIIHERHLLLQNRIEVEKNPEQQEAYEEELEQYHRILKLVKQWKGQI